LHSKTLSEAEAIIRNSPPSKPSSEITETANFLKGDLDSIVLKALRKESEHRYNSVALLIEDVDRHLTNRPVSARKGSFRYKTHKFFKRNVQLIFAVFLFTSALAVFGTYHYQQIKEEREIAELEAKKASAVSNYLVDLFSAANPINNVEDTLNVYDLLSIGKNRIQTLEEPVTQIILFVSLGNAYGNIGDFKEAISLLSQADSLTKIQLGTDSYESAYIAQSLGNIFAQQRNFTEAAKNYRQALSFFEPNSTEYGLRYSLSLTGLGNVYTEMNILDSAIIFSELAIKVGFENNIEYGELLSQELNLAKTYRAAGKFTEAERIYREVLADSARLKKDNTVYLSTVANNLAYLLLNDGRLEEAENYYRLAIKNHVRIYGEEHPSSIMLLSNLAGALQRQGKIVDAEEALQKKLNLNKSIYGTDSWQSGGSYQSLGILYFDSKDYEQAKTHFLNAVEIFSKTLGDVHPWTIRANLYGAYSILVTNPERDLSEVFKSNYESLEIASKDMSYNFKETLSSMVDKLQKSDRDMEYHINKLNEIISLASS
jgi:serine/threonine-protein kinase